MVYPRYKKGVRAAGSSRYLKKKYRKKRSAKMALTVGQRVKTIEEMHWHDGPAGAAGAQTASFSTTFVPLLLSWMRTTSAVWGRLGRRVTLRSLYLNGRINVVNNAATAYYPQCCLRIMLVYDKCCSGAGPALGDVLSVVDNNGNTTAAGAGGTLPTIVGLNMMYRDRFVVLADKKYAAPAVNITNNGAGNPGTLTSVEQGVGDQVGPVDGGCIRWFIKLPSLCAEFIADSGSFSTGDIGPGHIFLLLLSDTNNHPWQLQYNVRLKWHP